MTRTQVVWGEDWRDVSGYRNISVFNPNHYGEGAHLWADEATGSVHMLSHDGNLLGTTDGKHYSASMDDLANWTTQGPAFQAKGVEFADGTTRDFGRRERPHLVFKYSSPSPPPPTHTHAHTLSARPAVLRHLRASSGGVASAIKHIGCGETSPLMVCASSLGLLMRAIFTVAAAPGPWLSRRQ